MHRNSVSKESLFSSIHALREIPSRMYPPGVDEELNTIETDLKALENTSLTSVSLRNFRERLLNVTDAIAKNVESHTNQPLSSPLNTLGDLKEMLISMIKGRDCMKDLVPQDVVNTTNALFVLVFVYGDKMDETQLLLLSQMAMKHVIELKAKVEMAENLSI